MPFKSATQLVFALANKKISAVELLEETISRILLLDKKINAVVVRDFERARLTAKAADLAISKGEKKPLLGLPITVKESFNVAGLPTTWGIPQYKDWCPNEDSLPISRLKSAGAIIIGKTNVPRMLTDWQSFNDIYGTTNNPWNLHYTPGGSSGGSAAAVAAGFVSLELGSDFAGSIRVPANFCGIYGHKPSVNLVPMRGGGPPGSPPSPHLLSDLIVAGPLAITAADLALGLDVLAGPDEWWDGKAYKLFLPPPRHTALKNFRVLIIKSHPLWKTAESITNSIDDLALRLNKMGVKVSFDIESLPDLVEITRTFISIFSSYIGGNLPIEEFQKIESEAKMLSPNDESFQAYFLRGCIMTYREWLAKMRTRGALRQQWRKIFKEFDVVLCPVMPTLAFPHDHSDPATRQIEIDGQLFPYSGLYSWSSFASLFGFPSTAAPTGITETGLPLGIQIIGDYLEDYTTIKFAELLEREFGEPIGSLIINLAPPS